MFCCTFFRIVFDISPRRLGRLSQLFGNRIRLSIISDDWGQLLERACLFGRKLAHRLCVLSNRVDRIGNVHFSARQEVVIVVHFIGGRRYGRLATQSPAALGADIW